MMDKVARLSRAFDLELPDRPPILGGWLAAPEHVQALTGCSDDAYWADSFQWGLEAEHILGSDGVIDVFQPVERGGYRIVDHKLIERRARYTVESVLAEIEALPDPDELAAKFDEEQRYAELVADLQVKQAQCGDMLWCPADWELIPRALCIHEFGYDSSLMALALYPDRYRKWIQVNATKSRQKAVLYARAIREGIHPGVILTGEDACGQTGPLVSPDYLRREQFPLIEYAWEPLLEVGAKIVMHCDGDCRALVGDFLALGASGLQGFQQECGMDLAWIADKHTRHGAPLIIFGPMSVTTTLRGKPEDVRADVYRAMQICRGKASLVFFTSNTILPDVPLENIKIFWQTVLESSWD